MILLGVRCFLRFLGPLVEGAATSLVEGGKGGSHALQIRGEMVSVHIQQKGSGAKLFAPLIAPVSH